MAKYVYNPSIIRNRAQKRINEMIIQMKKEGFVFPENIREQVNIRKGESVRESLSRVAEVYLRVGKKKEVRISGEEAYELRVMYEKERIRYQKLMYKKGYVGLTKDEELEYVRLSKEFKTYSTIQKRFEAIGKRTRTGDASKDTYKDVERLRRRLKTTYLERMRTKVELAKSNLLRSLGSVTESIKKAVGFDIWNRLIDAIKKLSIQQLDALLGNDIYDGILPRYTLILLYSSDQELVKSGIYELLDGINRVYSNKLFTDEEMDDVDINLLLA